MRNFSSFAFAAPVVLAALAFAPRTAEACETCTSDAECPRGFACQVLTTDFSACMPNDCASDADCALGMRCVTGTATECVGSSCRQRNACAPRWQAGCNVDADCGEGFTCRPSGQACGPNGCVSFGSCETTLETACGSTADCPSGWSCVDGAIGGGGCMNPGGPGIAADASASPPATAVTGNVCRPPYWGLSVSYAGPGPGSGATSSGDDAGTSGFPASDPGAPAGSSARCATSVVGADGPSTLAGVGALVGAIALGSRRRRRRVEIDSATATARGKTV